MYIKRNVEILFLVSQDSMIRLRCHQTRIPQEIKSITGFIELICHTLLNGAYKVKISQLRPSFSVSFNYIRLNYNQWGSVFVSYLLVNTVQTVTIHPWCWQQVTCDIEWRRENIDQWSSCFSSSTNERLPFTYMDVSFWTSCRALES